MLAIVASQGYAFYFRVRLGKVPDAVPGVVGTAIVDKQNAALRVYTSSASKLANFRNKLFCCEREHVAFIEAGNDEVQFRRHDISCVLDGPSQTLHTMCALQNV